MIARSPKSHMKKSPKRVAKLRSRSKSPKRMEKPRSRSKSPKRVAKKVSHKADAAHCKSMKKSAALVHRMGKKLMKMKMAC